MRRKLKSSLTWILSSVHRATFRMRCNLLRIHNHALLSSRLSVPLDASVVVLGASRVYGTGLVSFGKETLLYPSLYFETDERGSIEIGKGSSDFQWSPHRLASSYHYRRWHDDRRISSIRDAIMFAERD